jgi:hypothetical protein
MTESDSELWGVELAIAGVMLAGAVLFPVEGVSVDIGTPVLLLATLGPADADGSETVVGLAVGPLLGLLLGSVVGLESGVLLTLTAAELGAAEKEVTESAADVA